MRRHSFPWVALLLLVSLPGCVRSCRQRPPPAESQALASVCPFGPTRKDMVADDHHAYYGCGRRIERVALGGGEAERVAVDDSFRHNLAIHGDSVYWTNQDGGLFKAPKSGGTAELVRSPVGNQPIAVDELGVYLSLDGDLVRLEPSSGTTTVLVPGGRYAALRLVDEQLYWLTTKMGSGELRMVPRTGGQSRGIVEAKHIKTFAVTADHIHFCATGGRYRVARGGGAPDKLSPWCADNLVVVEGWACWSYDRHYPRISGAVQCMPIDSDDAIDLMTLVDKTRTAGPVVAAGALLWIGKSKLHRTPLPPLP